MKYLLIGGAGVFAVHLAKYLLEKDETELVVCVGRNKPRNRAFTLDVGLNDKRYKFELAHINFEFDILTETLKKYKPDYVINFAALAYATSWNKSFRYYDTNCTSVARICEYLSYTNYLKQFLQIGTSELYGSVNKPVDENYAPNPTSPYAISKLAADMHVLSMFNALKFPGNVIRPSNCYGPGQLMYRIIPKAIYYSIKGYQFPLEGGGIVKKSFMHARDLARAIDLILHGKHLGKVYNAGVKKPVSMKKIVESIAEVAKIDPKSFIKETVARNNEDNQYWLDSSLMKKDFGWEPEIPLNEGIRDCFYWVKNNMSLIESEMDNFVLRA